MVSSATSPSGSGAPVSVLRPCRLRDPIPPSWTPGAASARSGAMPSTSEAFTNDARRPSPTTAPWPLAPLLTTCGIVAICWSSAAFENILRCTGCASISAVPSGCTAMRRTLDTCQCTREPSRSRREYHQIAQLGIDSRSSAEYSSCGISSSRMRNAWIVR